MRKSPHSPDWAALVRERLGPLPLDPPRAADIVDELAQHVAQHHADLVAAGVDDEAARAQALAPLADRARVIRDLARADRPRTSAPPPPAAASAGLFFDVLADVRYSLARLRRAPGFAATAIVMLALGLGVNTTIFSVLEAVLLRPLPYRDPSRLVLVGERGSNGANNVGYETFLDWRDRSRGFEALGLIRSWSGALDAGEGPERIAGMRVSANYFRLLGVTPRIGRGFRPQEDTPDGWHVVILSDRLWRLRFGADPTAIGRSVSISGTTFTIVGVLDPSYEPLLSEHFYQTADMWAPIGYDRSLSYACRSCQHLKAIGRLMPGVSIDAARRDIDGVQAALRAEHPADYDAAPMALVPFADELTGPVEPALAALMGAVAFVLLIACANVASLFLARMARREHDLALRTALGASRSRLVRELLVESTIVSAAGGALGLLVSVWALPLVPAIAPVAIARLPLAHLDRAVVAFAAATTLATALLFGLLPALRAARVDPHAALHADVRRTSRAPTSAARRLLVAADVALAVVLLAGAALMIKSVERLLDVNPGFDAKGVLSMQVALVGPAYADNGSVLAKTKQMLAALRTVPGVERVATASEIPLSGNGDCDSVHIQNRPSATPAADPCPERYGVTPDYFAAMGVPLLSGRLFSDADADGAEQVLVVGERTASSLWPDGDAIGQHVRIGAVDSGPWRTIVGIVGNVRHQALASPPTMQMYTPQWQLPDSFLTLVIRTSGDPASLAGAARAALRSASPDVAVYNVATVDELVARSVAPRRFMMRLLALFGALALLMTAIGVYGVIAYSVGERTREIGIRRALGASRAAVAVLVIGTEFRYVVAGLLTGLAIAAAGTRALAGSLYGVSATDPPAFAAVALLLIVVALAAQAMPTARAIGVDPAAALRQE